MPITTYNYLYILINVICMNNKKMIGIVAILIMLVLPGIAAAAIDDANTGMMPTLSQAWGGLNGYLKEKITWLLGLAVIGMVVVGVLYSALSGGGVLMSGGRGDVAGRSNHVTNVFMGIGVIFVALLAISIIFWLVS